MCNRNNFCSKTILIIFCTVPKKFLGPPYTLNGYLKLFTHDWLFRKRWFTEFYKSSKCWHTSLHCSKKKKNSLISPQILSVKQILFFSFFFFFYCDFVGKSRQWLGPWFVLSHEQFYPLLVLYQLQMSAQWKCNISRYCENSSELTEALQGFWEFPAIPSPNFGKFLQHDTEKISCHLFYPSPSFRQNFLILWLSQK